MIFDKRFSFHENTGICPATVPSRVPRRPSRITAQRQSFHSRFLRRYSPMLTIYSLAYGASLTHEHEAVRSRAEPLTGGPRHPARITLLHEIFLDTGGDHAFPGFTLHGALWAYSFFEGRGAVSSAIAYHYFTAQAGVPIIRTCCSVFRRGPKKRTDACFVDTYFNYVFAKRHGEAPGADEILAPPLLEALNRVHQARRAGTRYASETAPKSSRRHCSTSRNRLSARRSARRLHGSTALSFRRSCYARLFGFRSSHARRTWRSATSVTRMSG